MACREMTHVLDFTICAESPKHVSQGNTDADPHRQGPMFSPIQHGGLLHVAGVSCDEVL
jgi:hypothetical protein